MIPLTIAEVVLADAGKIHRGVIQRYAAADAKRIEDLIINGRTQSLTRKFAMMTEGFRKENKSVEQFGTAVDEKTIKGLLTDPELVELWWD